MASTMRTTVLVLMTLAMALVWGADSRAQSEDLLEAKELYDRGRDDEGLAKLRDLLASGPDQETASDLLSQVDSSFWLELLVKGGDHEQVATEILDLAAVEQKQREDDADAIEELVDRLASQDFGERNDARLELSSNHGAYAVPHLLDRLGKTQSSEYRINLLYALTQMGSEAVLPIMEALRSPEGSVRRDVILLLGNIGDSRSVGALLRHREIGDTDSAEAALVTETLERMGASASSGRETLLDQAEAYLDRRPAVLKELEVQQPIWSFNDGRLVKEEVPPQLYHLLMAEKFSYEALEVAPGDEEVLEVLTRAMIEQQEALDAATAAGDDTGNAEGRVARAANLAIAAGPEEWRAALREEMYQAEPEVEIPLIDPLAETDADDLIDGLYDEDKRIRHASATALATAPDSGVYEARIVEALIEAVSEQSVRTVLVIDNQPDARNAILASARDNRMYALGASSGLDGLERAKSLAGADLYIVRADLPDVATDRMLRDFDGDYRTKNTPVLLLASDDNLVDVMNRFEGRVAGFMGAEEGVSDAIDSALEEDSNESRQQALEAAGKAADALYLLAARGDADLSRAVPVLIATLNRPDSVRLSAIRALGEIGSKSAMSGLMEVLGNSGNSATIRSAAALAMGQISSANGRIDRDAFDALGEALSDSEAIVAGAAARALGIAALSGKQRTTLVNRNRPGRMDD